MRIGETTVQAPRPPATNPRRAFSSAWDTTGAAHAIILAGGEGVRLQPLTRALAGDERPKQFCNVVGSESLLEQTRRRAALLVPPERTSIVLTRRHEPYYREIVADAPPGSLVVQPENRGTATAVLYALLRISARSSPGPVVILPSDHWVSNDVVFMAHAAAAAGVVSVHKEVVVLLGVAPTRAEPEYGWIEPSERTFGEWMDLHRVRRFVEKPSPEAARSLQNGRSLWNSSVVVGDGRGLGLLFGKALPGLVAAFLEVAPDLDSPAEEASVERLYRRLPSSDLSRDVLASQPESLAVLGVSGVSWEDLGQPARALAARRRSAGAYGLAAGR